MPIYKPCVKWMEFVDSFSVFHKIYMIRIETCQLIGLEIWAPLIWFDTELNYVALYLPGNPYLGVTELIVGVLSSVYWKVKSVEFISLIIEWD